MKALAVWILMLPCSLLWGQTKLFLKGEEAFALSNPTKAEKYWLKSFEKHQDLASACLLATYYHRNDRFEEAELFFHYLFVNGDLPDSLVAGYADTELSLGKYATAEILLKDRQSNPNTRGSLDKLYQRALLGQELMTDSSQYRVSEVVIPTKASTFCPAVFAQGVILTMGNDKGKYSLAHVKRKGRSYFTYDEISPLKELQERNAGMGAACLSSNWKTIYFTRTYYFLKDPIQGQRIRNNSRILFSQRKAGEWDTPQDLPINSALFSCYHPTISANDSVLVFASDRPGGLGGSDLYIIKKERDGWGLPQNLGKAVNGAQEELFPTLVGKDTLYFASESHPGMGGLDIYLTWREDGVWVQPQNLGYPINTHHDDFALVPIQNKPYAYFCSNRSSAQDKIFIAQLRPEVEVSVTDKETGQGIEGMTVRVEEKRKRDRFFLTDKDGFTTITGVDQFTISTETATYENQKTTISTINNLPGKGYRINFELASKYKMVVQGEVRNKTTGEAIPNAEIKAFYSGSTVEASTRTDPKGFFQLNLAEPGETFLLIEKEGFQPEIRKLSQEGDQKQFTIICPLAPSSGQVIRGRLENLDQLAPLKGITLRITETQSGTVLDSIQPNENGTFWISSAMDSTKSYTILVSGAGYFSHRQDIVPNQEEIPIRMQIAERGAGKLIKTIFYGYNRIDLETLSQQELNEITYFLLDNPDAVVEIRSFTDSRGGARYNQKLSEKRSQVVKKSILAQSNISPDRIVAFGFGEKYLLNECDDLHTCSDERHAVNRRSEIRVVRLKSEP